MTTARNALANSAALVGLSALLILAGPFARCATAKDLDPEIQKIVKQDDAAFGDLHRSWVESAEKPTSLPDMALGSATAPITGFFYTGWDCSKNCKSDLQTLKTQYIDTGKLRLVIRLVPLDAKAAAGEMVARCIAAGDAKKYFETFQVINDEADNLAADPLKTLIRIGSQTGMSQQAIEGCIKDQVLSGKLLSDTNFAVRTIVIKKDGPVLLLKGANFYDKEWMGKISFNTLDWRLKSASSPAQAKSSSKPAAK